MAISEFEKQRQANIARNKELLRKLNLNTLANEFGKSDSKSSNKPKPKKNKNIQVKIEKEPNLPLRRSRRIAGVKVEDTKGNEELDKLEEKKLEDARLKELESIRLSDDLKLSDVLSDVSVLSKLGKSFSMGDFYDDIKNKPLSNKTEEQAREDLGKLELYEDFHPNQIMLTTARMTTIEFHPSNKRKLIFGGDTNGMLGIWSVDDDDKDEPSITRFNPHRKNIARIGVRPNTPEEVISCSYDGSLRVMDMSKNISKSILEYDDQWGEASGISDFKLIDKNNGYLTTLNGEFARFDIRENNITKREDCSNYRLHDKKIGYFSVCPTDSNLVASASLDRTMRIWDLRMIRDQVWSDYEDVKGPQCIAAYRSRLSVSCTDWNKRGDIVCNGYDDTIRVFQLNKSGNGILQDIGKLTKPESGDVVENLEPDVTIKHNCQSGRWVSILKSRWHENPVDGIEKFVIANMKRHLDVYTRDGTMLAHFTDDRMTSVPAVCTFHPMENWIVGGNSSGKVFLLT